MTQQYQLLENIPKINSEIKKDTQTEIIKSSNKQKHYFIQKKNLFAFKAILRGKHKTLNSRIIKEN